MNKLTDSEIVKALECCSEPAGKCCCEVCPLHYREDSCTTALIKMTVELVNRQNAEIERLQKAIKVQDIMIGNQDLKIKGAINEAIKEFAEKVKPILREMFNLMIDDDEGKCIIEDCKKHSSLPCMNEYCIKENLIAWETKIDNLVKEMVGDYL